MNGFLCQVLVSSDWKSKDFLFCFCMEWNQEIPCFRSGNGQKFTDVEVEKEDVDGESCGNGIDDDDFDAYQMYNLGIS